MLRRNILIFHLGALGDFVLTWPLALALGRMHPQSRIIYVTHAQKGALAGRILGVESIDIESGWHHLFGDPSKLPPPAAAHLGAAHSIYTFIAIPGDGWCENVTRLSPHADVICLQLTPPPRPDEPIHATDHLLAQLSSRPAIAEGMRQMLASIHQRGVGRHAGSANVAVLHPGSGSPFKCWPPEHFLELAHRLRHAGRSVRILLGETELERWPAHQAQQFETVAEVRRPQSYLELADALSDAAVYIGNDSGPSHLAGILGVNTICLFGPTDPTTWHPLGPHVRILQRMPMESITPDEVAAHMPL